ncbi:MULTISPECIES: Na(+)/H(+) antiporter subunit C [Bacillaceae]|uniref:Cation:proton antiporter n=4 Tax=Bacillaceae TaxID=186817 RepID=A0A9D5DPS2_9BACI|nr:MULTISPECIES: Na(+)/H(+) antiporter subunit C [Bacillaceae]KQL58046.1 cation:proton antiporter [Alkalicoccobacillus plakortidis]MBG9785656.1 monovalent cation/H+ antiporter subunit C [Shouchella lehensis]MED4127840.1 Na(+)/H(+) antiporter subunit C [Shouchella miscanthi]TES48117.1 Na(+)/H(+) antiporter subunit C [Shouchella lehensis]WDF02991.1 Na(+)/H(+) antiporter subunit C [Shouchella hunanensis]
MEILMFIAIGVLFAVGTYFILCRSLLKVIIGILLISHGAHMLLLTMAGLRQGVPPLVDLSGSEATDPLPQAMILTAIVISFGITAFLVVLAYRTYRVNKTEDLDKLRGSDDE